MLCQFCEGENLEEWAIFRDGDRRKEKITYMCSDCNKTTTTEEHDY